MVDKVIVEMNAAGIAKIVVVSQRAAADVGAPDGLAGDQADSTSGPRPMNLWYTVVS
jgi:hypothetical protein